MIRFSLISSLPINIDYAFASQLRLIARRF